MLSRAERNNSIIQTLITAAAPSSAIAGLFFFDTPLGKIAWQYLAAIAAIVSILQPSFRFPKKIKDYESLCSGYRVLFHDLSLIKSSVLNKKVYDQESQTQFKQAMLRLGELIKLSPNEKENRKLKKRCVQEVDRAHPAESFYIPENQ